MLTDNNHSRISSGVMVVKEIKAIFAIIAAIAVGAGIPTSLFIFAYLNIQNATVTSWVITGVVSIGAIGASVAILALTKLFNEELKDLKEAVVEKPKENKPVMLP
ncbi:MAG TPA: hypothetical protein DHW82_08040 [Spirochaetia bacterium]|nr:MAG: hypothetical protein A2Y41_06670 [Spirochaetes bacterium GWB1_36_13]HCL56943.1 hypothetical protein [Spirochaetia bacterium]